MSNIRRYSPQQGLPAASWNAAFLALKSLFFGPRTLWFHGFLITLLTVARQPKALFDAQFWAEDGRYWYQEAYESGWACIFQPHTGYLQSISRLTALLAIHVPLVWAPLLFALVALVIQVLPPIFFLSSRFDAVLPSRAARLVLAYFYVAIPNSWEVHVNLTNAHTHLALLGFLIVVSQCPSRTAEWVFDLFFLVLAGLSGPFVICLAPIAWLHWFHERSRQQFIRSVVVSSLAVIQVHFGLFAPRLVPPLGADGFLLAQIISNQVVLGAELGERLARPLIAAPVWSLPWTPVVSALAAGVVVIAAFIGGPNIYRLFVLFASLQLAAALVSPAGSMTEPQWPKLIHLGYDGRYFLLPMLAWFASLIVLTSLRWRMARIIATVLVAISAAGILGDWHLHTSRQVGFEQAARAFDQAVAGTKMSFPINPDGWSMTLTKH